MMDDGGSNMTDVADTLAPWAEVAPDAGPAKVEDLLATPDDGWRYEVVEGVLVRMAGSGDIATGIALLIGSILLAYARPRRLGRVTGADGVYKFQDAETGLLPDVGFYGAALFPRVVDRRKPVPLTRRRSRLTRAGRTRDGGKSMALSPGRDAPHLGRVAGESKR